MVKMTSQESVVSGCVVGVGVVGVVVVEAGMQGPG